MQLHVWGLIGMLWMSASTWAAIPDEGEKLANLGRILANEGRYQEARGILEQAQRSAESLDPAGIRMAEILNNLGSVYARLDRISEAERCYRRSSAIWEQRGDVANALAPLTNLAGIYTARRQYSAAEHLLRDALSSRIGPDNPHLAAILTYLADFAVLRGDYATAAELGERALEILRKAAAGPDLAMALDNLGTIYRAQNRMADASRLFEEAIQVLERSHQAEHPAWIPALYSRGLVLSDTSHYREAEPLLARSLDLAERKLGPNHPEVAQILRSYAVVMRKTGRKSEAKKMQAQAARIEQQSSRANAVGYTVDLGSLTAFHPPTHADRHP